MSFCHDFSCKKYLILYILIKKIKYNKNIIIKIFFINIRKI